MLIVLISCTRQRGMIHLLRTVQRFCCAMNMKLAVEKTVMLSSGPENSSWNISSDNPTLNVSVVGKDIPIEINIKGRNLIKS